MGSKFFLALVYLTYFVAGGLAAAVSVTDHGAVGDGKTDDTKAFLAAWSASCGGAGTPTVLVPAGKTFLVGPVAFSGPCRSSIHVQVDGNIVAPGQRWTRSAKDHWITFSDVRGGLTVDGNGQFDGNGNVWWACRKNNQCSDAPDAVAFEGCNNLTLSGLRFTNSPKKHITIHHSNGVHLSGLTITAPEDSPNTDGVHIEDSQQVGVFNSNIGTGDDCVSIGTGSSNVNVSEINCGPGHGISVGSLGKDHTQASVEQIFVSNCHFEKTQNGVRIKTWPGGSGFARGITFQNVNFSSAENPIIIDQFYCDHRSSCQAGQSAVKIQDVRYIGATGTTTSKVAVALNCSAAAPCTGVTMESVDIKSAGGPPAVGVCKNAVGTKRSTVIPTVPCLK